MTTQALSLKDWPDLFVVTNFLIFVCRLLSSALLSMNRAICTSHQSCKRNESQEARPRAPARLERQRHCLLPGLFFAECRVARYTYSATSNLGVIWSEERQA